MTDVLTKNTKAFENASTNVAAAQMRNSLTELSETVKDPEQKKVLQPLIALYYLIKQTNWFTRCSRPKWTTSLLSSDDT